MKPVYKKRIYLVIIAALYSFFQSIANAGGFSLYTEASPAAIGNFAAGIAAEGGDAAIGWYNPAGLVLIEDRQLVIGGVGVFPSSKLTGTSTFTTVDPDPDAEPIAPYIQSFSRLQGAENALVPAFHYALPLGERAGFGLSMVSPFGLSTRWGRTSPVRYAATTSKLMTVNLSPELGGEITDYLSIGAGLDLQWARVTFDQVIGSPAVLQAFEQAGFPITPTTLDSFSHNKGHSFGIGVHAGILGIFNDYHTRIGLNYQSKIGHMFQGKSTLTGRLADPDLTNSNAQFVSNYLFSNTIHLPEIVTLSAYHDVNTRLALLGSAVYTGWSVFQTIQLNNIAAFSADTQTQALLSSTSIENYRNTWRFALGANYYLNYQWMFRMGVGYDQTPTNNLYREVRLPDANRVALSVGSHYQMFPYLGFDIGYTYLFATDVVNINKTAPVGASSNNITAHGNVHANLLGLQAVWTIS